MPQDPMGDTSKAQQQIADMKQAAKEKDIQEKAKRMGYSYVNLLHFMVNPDLKDFVPQEKSMKAKVCSASLTAKSYSRRASQQTRR